MAITKAEWVKKRVAEGFTKEDAIREYDNLTDPMIAKAQEQKVPTRGEMLQMIHEAMQNNPNKKKRYSPDFSLSKQYKELRNKANEAFKAQDMKLAEALNAQALSLKISGTISTEAMQTEIDKTLEMPIADVLKERKCYENIITECEEKLDSFDVSAAQAKVDALEAEYKRKANSAKSGMARATLWDEHNKAVEAVELEMVTIPMNDLKIKRYEAREFFLIYEARVKAYVSDNRELIKGEIENARREEIRGSLLDLTEVLEREEEKKAALGMEG